MAVAPYARTARPTPGGTLLIARSGRRRLAVSAAAVLAVTLGAGALTGPAAVAAPAETVTLGSYDPAEIAETSPAQVPTGYVDLDRTPRVDFGFHLNNPDAKVTIHLANNQTRGWYRWTQDGFDPSEADGKDLSGGYPFTLAWEGVLHLLHVDGDLVPYSAQNGTYTWTMTAEPRSGVGPTLTKSGTFTVTRKPRPHDFNDNSSFDLLARDAQGRLRMSAAYREAESPDSRSTGYGWDVYDRLEATGDISGNHHADFVTRDRSGVLWLYRSNGGRTRDYLDARSRVGGGWQVYRHLAGGSDFSGDARPDLVAADASGVLWHYRSTGALDTVFAPRKRIGGGWQIYNQITAVGNVAGAAPGDLVARDKDGVLWLYLGKGDGTFTTRERLGGGFGRYSELVGGGDYDGDGRNDLLAVEPATKTVYVFKGTGLRHAPFDLTRKATPLFKGDAFEAGLSYDLTG
ncbi:FG-GAP-like repeat-containing protein [Streptomyces hydrogenans]|uniref:FG-GAP-like repeat-containing protein n=1 Tax=Streptomyces hydrogenans TaxID=1873719 RepID=UPI003667C0D5